MAPSSSSSSSSSKPSLSPPLPPSHFTPIQECEREGNEEDETPNSCTDKREVVAVSGGDHHHHHNPTPLHHHPEKRGRTKPSSRKRPESDGGAGEDRGGGINCNKCRPSSREKISVVPLDASNRSSVSSPNGLLRSIFALMKKSPIPPRSSEPPETAREEQWKIAVAELSHKLIHATRKRDEAVLEASRLKSSVAELERKLNKLEIYCHNLKSNLEICTKNSPSSLNPKLQTLNLGDEDRVIEHLLVSIAESRTLIRTLSRSLASQIRQVGQKVYDRLSLLLQPYDIKVSLSKNPRTLLYYLEALLNRAFYEDFESIGFQKSGSNRVLNPIDCCESNFAAFEHLQGLTWDDVLNRGTRHFSEEFSKFCDRKMSEIVAMLGWTRAWPEPLLQAFFGASKSVWLVHLLANSVHPSLPIFRVDTGSDFDSVYMEDMGGDRARRLVPDTVRVMVTPGFYVYGNVVKCKVLCRYQSSNNGKINESSDKGLTLSPK